jgi:hypothetical protein
MMPSMTKDEKTLAEEKKLEAIVERVVVALERFSSAALWTAAKNLRMGIPLEINKYDVAVGEWVEPKKLWGGADALAKALASRTKQARIAALPLLVSLDKKLAANFFAEAMMVDLSNAWAVSYAAALHRGVWHRWAEMKSLVPKERFVRLWLEGRFATEALTNEHIRSVPLDELSKWVRDEDLADIDASDVARIRRARPDLTSLEACLVFLESSLGDAPYTDVQTAFIDHFANLFAQQRYEAALPLLRRVGALEALFAMNDRVTLAPLADSLEAITKRQRLKWDPHHVADAIEKPIRAAFQLDPKTAYDRLGRYLTKEAVKTEHGAKIANDILMLGQGMIVSHGGTKLASRDGALIHRDPRFLDALRAIANQPRLLTRIRTIVGAKGRGSAENGDENHAARSRKKAAAKKKIAPKKVRGPTGKT